MKIDYDKRAADLGHNVPKAGTLWEISYCRLCGDAFNTDRPCPKKRLDTESEKG